MSRRERDETAALADDAEEEDVVRVIHDLDGGIDDYVSLQLLLSAQFDPTCFDQHIAASGADGRQRRRIRVIGVTVVEADCFAVPCVDVCRRLLALYAAGAAAAQRPRLAAEFLGIPCAASALNGTAAPFPTEFRMDSWNLNDMPILHSPAVNAAFARRKPSHSEAEEGCGAELMAQLVLSSPAPVVIVATGPLTNVAYCIRTYGDRFAKNVARLVWMGGAVEESAGNVLNKNLPEAFKRTPAWDTRGVAEWNVYWDAPSARAVFECAAMAGGKIVVVPLNATDKVPVLQPFVRRIGSVVRQETPDDLRPTALASFMGGAWALVTYVSRWAGSSYFAWDVLTAAFLIDATLLTLVPAHIDVVVRETNPDEEGRTVMTRVAGGVTDAACNACVAMDVDAARFYEVALDAARLF